MRIVSRTLLFGATSALLLLSGCKGCSKQGGEAATEEAVKLPTARAEVIDAYLSALPASTRWFAIIPDPTALMKGFGAVHTPVGRVVPQLRLLESDIKNTIGVDLADPATLTRLGIPAHSGVAFANDDNAPVAMLFVEDKDKFLGEIHRIVTNQPYAYGATTTEKVIGGLTFKVYQKPAPETRTLYVSVDKGLARIVGAADTARADAAVTALTGASAGSLKSRPGIAEQLKSADGMPLVVWFDVNRVANEGSGEPPAGSSAAAVRGVIGKAGVAVAGLSLEARALQLRVSVQPSADAQNKSIFAPPKNAVAPTFGRVLTPETYAFARATTKFSDLLDAARGAASPQDLAEINRGVAELDKSLGLSLEADVLPALGSGGLVAATRARLLSLGSARSPGDYINALGVVASWQVTDRAKLDAAIDKVLPVLANRAEKFIEKGATVLRFTDPTIDFGNVILTDSLLLLAPDRDRAALLDQLAAAEPPASRVSDPDGQSLLSSAEANGVFIDVGQIMSGPIGQVFGPRLPEAAQQLLALLDSLVIKARYEGGMTGVDLTVRLLEEPASPPPGTAPAAPAGSGSGAVAPNP